MLKCIAAGEGALRAAGERDVHSCYEAGRDGWWLHRWLKHQGIDNIVVDSSSIEVNRHARRAKSDRLDGDKLLQMLLRHRRGERVWSVLHEPSAQAETSSACIASCSGSRTNTRRTATAFVRCWCCIT